MKVLVIGSGAREHTLAWSLKSSPLVRELFIAPGNPGTAALGRNLPIRVDALDELASFALEQGIDLSVVGPEYPLSLGIVDKFRSLGLKIFGPSAAASQLESSKGFAKDVMQKAGVRTAAFQSFSGMDQALAFLAAHKAPYVLKADGLAAGKGVVICASAEEGKAGLEFLFSELGSKSVLIESFLTGREVSFIVATDGRRIVPFASSHDYKRVHDDDQGPNTGGMGSVSPSPRLSFEQESQVIEEVIKPVLREMERRGAPFTGFLYAGLMIDADQNIWVLEFNARFGDPECQSVMFRLQSDLAQTLYTLCDEKARPADFEVSHLKWSDKKAVCVVLAAQGYPDKARTGDEIFGLAKAAEQAGVSVFHAGTVLNRDGKICTAGGRIISVTAGAGTYQEAGMLAYRVCDIIDFNGKHFRRDIGKH